MAKTPLLTKQEDFIIQQPNFAKIGDVKQSFLTEAEFQAEHDDTWVLCDGRDVIGSDYAILKEGDAVTSHNIPDARGQFLRGLDTSGTVDPDGAGRSLGDSQADEFESHNHTHTTYTTSTGAVGGGQIWVGYQTVNTGDAGGSETRPKNVAVNMFIKINREPSS